MMAGSVGPTDAVVIDVIHPGAARDGGLDPVADAEPVRPRGRPAPHRRCFPTRTDCSSRWPSCPLFCLLAAALFVVAARTYVADLKQARARRAGARERARAAGGVTMNHNDDIAMNSDTEIRSAPRARAQAGRERQLESRLGAVRQARSRLDREGDRDGDRARRSRAPSMRRRSSSSASRSTSRARTCTRPACAGTSSAR